MSETGPDANSAGLHIRLDGYEGPLDVLLALAREQKLDLLQISIAALAEQYLEFVERARAARLQLAADYLVMAAWLTLLKSRLLLPEEDAPPDESAEAEADAMRRRLWHLQKIRDAAHALTAQPQLGRDFFAPGAARGERVAVRHEFHASLSALLTVHAQWLARRSAKRWTRAPEHMVSVETARTWLKERLPQLKNWTRLEDFWLGETRASADGMRWQMMLSGGYAAALGAARDAELELRQQRLDAPLLMRRRARARERSQ